MRLPVWILAGLVIQAVPVRGQVAISDLLFGSPGEVPKAQEKRKATTPVLRRRQKARRVRANPFAAASGRWAWRIVRERWTKHDERGFEAFVEGIGQSDCASVHECLTSAKSNPRFHDKHPRYMRFFADCADLPYLLRAYYAWQVGLPFSFSTDFGAHRVVPGGDVLQPGNKIVSRIDIVGPGPDGRKAIPAVGWNVSSEHFRTPPHYKEALPPDYYPVRISRASVRPGTVIFDPGGHVAIVYRVSKTGRIHYFDAHPDNTVSRGAFNRTFARAAPGMGAGFKRWRPQRLEGATRSRAGTLLGGRVVRAPDEALADWSDEQFFGTRRASGAPWHKGRFEVGGSVVDFHHFVRLRLAPPGFQIDPLDEVRTMVASICRQLRYRVAAVDAAMAAGIATRPQPDRLPGNIYATTGDWEIYATPSRDARLKVAFKELRDETLRLINLVQRKSPVVVYEGADLLADLRREYINAASACVITFTKSDGTEQSLTFEDVRRRLFKLSFDPHHCMERRWGASEEGELESCRDGPTKTAWYEAQQSLRNQVIRTYGMRMGWTLRELTRPSAGIGSARAPHVDLLKFLAPRRREPAGRTPLAVGLKAVQ